jgi:hypothetical protein
LAATSGASFRPAAADLFGQAGFIIFGRLRRKRYANRPESDTAVVTDIQAVPMGPDSVQVSRLFGDPHTKNEELRDYELGYRSEPTQKISLDVATFLSFYTPRRSAPSTRN